MERFLMVIDPTNIPLWNGFSVNTATVYLPIVLCAVTPELLPEMVN